MKLGDCSSGDSGSDGDEKPEALGPHSGESIEIAPLQMEMAPLDHGHGNGASSPGTALLWRRFQSDEIAKAVKFVLAEGFGKTVSDLPLSGNIL